FNRVMRSRLRRYPFVMSVAIMPRCRIAETILSRSGCRSGSPPLSVTMVVPSPHDLDAATVGIADELSKQYYLVYLSPGKKDDRWHSIRVEVRNGRYRMRARRGYVAS